MEDSITFRLPALRPQKSSHQISTFGSAAAPPESSDETLMLQIRQGNTDALTLLFGRYARIVRAVAYSILRDAAEADDLLQDIFLLIQRKCGLFDPSRAPARSWILAIAHRSALARRRYLNSRHFYTRVDLQEVEDQMNASRNGSGDQDGMFGNSALMSAFRGLSVAQRETLRLFFVEGYTLPEIAVKLNQSHGNVKHHYFRGLDKLRKHVFNGKLRGNSAV